jgi:hypothetical protein
MLGAAFAASLIALYSVAYFDPAKLALFGPTAQIYLSGIRSSLAASSSILGAAFLASLLFGKQLRSLSIRAHTAFSRESGARQALVVLIICVAFAFASHAGNIMHGYFNMDDFLVVGLNHSVPLSQSILIPYANDHTIPLFRAEMWALDAFFGVNPIPYNIFFFLIFALIPFFAYLSMRRLGIGLIGFAVFLVLFAGATSWADMLTGFYIMSLYTQILLFFSIAAWAYLAWTDTREKKYLATFALALIFAAATDTSSIWVFPVLLSLMATSHFMRWDRTEAFFPSFIKRDGLPLAKLALVAILFSIFLFISFKIIQPGTFLSALSADGTPTEDAKAENWAPAPLAFNFISFFANGVSLPVVAPSATKLLAHPALKDKARPFWPLVGLIVLVANIALFWYALRKGEASEKPLVLWALLSMAITIGMVIVARPDHSIIPDFDYRYAGAPFFFYCFCFAIFASWLVRSKGDKAKEYVVSALIIIFALQQAFSFHAFRLEREALARREAITLFDETFFGTLKETERSLVIPNLSGNSIYPAMAGFTLAHYFLFFDSPASLALVRNDAMPPNPGVGIVETVPSLRAAVTPGFRAMMKTDPVVHAYYASTTLMHYTASVPAVAEAYSAREQNAALGDEGRAYVRFGSFDPENLHKVTFSLSTLDIPGNVELMFSFKNDFNAGDRIGKLKIDDYAPYTVRDGRRIYQIETDMLQLYAYSLSNRVSDLLLSVTPVKEAVAYDISIR